MTGSPCLLDLSRGKEEKDPRESARRRFRDFTRYSPTKSYKVAPKEIDTSCKKYIDPTPVEAGRNLIGLIKDRIENNEVMSSIPLKNCDIE